MTTFTSQRDRVKAKLVTIGRPGEQVRQVVPEPSSFIEVKWWVLGHKIRVALGVVFLLCLGAHLGLLGLNWLLWGVGVGAVLALFVARPCP